MREFDVVHISDLHVTGKTGTGCGVLRNGIQAAIEKLVGLQTPLRPRILVVTGDIVDSPTKKALENASAFLEEVSSLFQHTVLVPGNHDAKRCLGNFFRRKDYFEWFKGKTSLWAPAIGLQVLGIDATQGNFARGKITSVEYDRVFRERYSAGIVQEASVPVQDLLRIAAVHHHPLPLAEGEGHGVMGIEDERFMYLKNPARFLHACLSYGFSIVLHGHRHVHGVVKYSTESRDYLPIQEERWSTLYVVSCPSSTDKGGKAGFNVLSMHLGHDGSYSDLRRYRRQGEGAFELVDRNRPDGAIRLRLDFQMRTTVGLNVQASLDLLSTDVGEIHLFPLLREMFYRQSFYICPEPNYRRILHSYVYTKLLWKTKVLPKLRPDRRQAADCVLIAMKRLEQLIGSEYLGMSEGELGQLESLVQTPGAFDARLPLPSRHSNKKMTEILEKRRSGLRELNRSLKQCGIDDLGIGDIRVASTVPE